MCPTLSNPENGQVMVNTLTVGGVATYTCNNGFTLTGASMRMCVQNGVIGQWTMAKPTKCLQLGELLEFTCELHNSSVFVYNGKHRSNSSLLTLPLANLSVPLSISLSDITIAFRLVLKHCVCYLLVYMHALLHT